jgi:hypothetical protein
MPRILVLLLCLLAGACSLRGAIDAMTSPEDRAFAQEMVTRLRSGDEAWLQQRFQPELWERSAKQIGGVPALFPRETGTTELIGYSFSTRSEGGPTVRTKEFTLVTEGGGRWIVTTFRTHSAGGPDLVVQWSVVPHSAPPAELTMLEGVDRALPWIWGTLIAGVLAVAALIIWLVRRSRRRRAAQITGMP